MTTPITNISFFTPRSVTGLSGWYDGNDLLGTGATPSNGFSISQWSDKSSNANHAIQATASNRPFFSNTGIVFSGTQNLNFTNPNALVSNTRFSVFIVEQRASGLGTNYIFAGSTNLGNQNLHIGYNSSTTFRLGYYGNDLDYNIPAYSAGSEPFRIWSITQSNTGREIILNGSFAARNGNTTLLQSWNGGSIGRNFFGAGTPFYYGTVKEIIFYKPSLERLQQQQIEGYLAWKYSLQRSLPLTHPYFNNPQQSVYPYTLVRTIPQPKINVPAWSLFNPLSIASCSLWLDSSSLNNFTLSNTSNVVQWNDKSRNQKHFRTIVGTPTLISPSQGVFFNGTTADCMQSSSNSIQPSSNISYTAGITSLFVVTRITGINSGFAYVIVFGNATDFSLRYTQGGAGNNNDIFNTRSLFYNGASQGIFSIPVAAFSNTSLINGVVNITNSTVIQLSLGPVSVGGHSNRYLTGFINEVLIYSTPLTAQQRQQVEGYLTYKWNIQPRLVDSHPAKNNFLYPVLPSIPTGVSVPNKITITSRFTPRSLSGLSLWLDAADSATVLNPGTSNMVWVDKSGTGKNAIVSPSNASLNFYGTFPTYCNAGNIPTSIQFNCNIMYSTSNIDVAQNTFFIVLQNILPHRGARAVFSIASSRQQPYNSVDAFEVGMSLFAASSVTPNVFYGITQGVSSSINFATQTVPSPSTNQYPFSMLSFTETNTATINTFTNGAAAQSATNSGTRSNTGTGYAICGEWINRNTNVASTNMGTFNISEIILYSNVLTTQQRQNVEGYLSWKWGLRSSLPSTHQNVFIPPS
jgi:hypothetical protein